MSDQELNTLRTELLQDYSEIAQYNCILYSVIAAVLAFGIHSDNYLLCMIPYLVLFPIHFMCENRRDGVSRIGAYLYIFSGENYLWEQRLHKLDTIRNRAFQKKYKNGTVIFKFLRDKMHFQYYFIAVFCSLASIYKIINGDYSFNGMVVRITVIVLVTICAIIVICKTIVFTPERRQYYINYWKAIKEQEKTSRMSAQTNQ